MKKLLERDTEEILSDIKFTLKKLGHEQIKTIEDLAEGGQDPAFALDLLQTRAMEKHKIYVLDGKILTREEGRHQQEEECENGYEGNEVEEYYEAWECVHEIANLLANVSALYCHLKAREEAMSPLIVQLVRKAEEIGY